MKGQGGMRIKHLSRRVCFGVRAAPRSPTPSGRLRAGAISGVSDGWIRNGLLSGCAGDEVADNNDEVFSIGIKYQANGLTKYRYKICT